MNTVFGNAFVLISPNMPLNVKVNSVFASSKLPDNNMVSFGESYYRSSSLNESTPCLNIEGNTVFGNLEIKIIR
ncbi:MAG: hypothetical protein HC906_09790 [Bacteroidales bacterium]|nr:hypothetical protein [Bacteroidales bacterium]